MQSESLEALLRAERQVKPEPGAEERIWAGLEHRLAQGPPPPGGADLPPGGVGGAAGGGAAGGGGLALKLVGGLALVAASVGVWATREPPEPAAPAVAEAPIEAVPEVRLRVPPPAPAPVPASALVPVPTSEPEPEREPEPAFEDEPGEVAKKKPRAKVEAAKTEPAAPVDFAAELQLIAQIRGALKQGDSARALAGVEEHRRVFGARGQLVQERLAYHVEALCAAGRVGEAKKVAGDLLTRWPDSTHAPRVKKSCAGA